MTVNDNDAKHTIESAKEHAKNKSTWTRGFFILVFLALLGLGKTLVIAILAFQFLHVLTTGGPNKQLIKFGGQLCAYIKEVMEYLIYVRDDRPFPFGDWPDERSQRAES